MTDGRTSILLVEDEADVRELISLHLKRDGYAVTEAAEGLGVVERVRENAFDLIILDWMLPKLNGVDIARGIRQELRSEVPILMVTARVDAVDIVVGLEAGADDYVTKPFQIPVLMARVRSLLRRSSASGKPAADAKPSEKLAIGNLRLDLARYEAHCGDKELQLTTTEFKLLAVLMENPGRVLTREKLIDLIRGEDVSVISRSIDTHVFGLRKKLGPCADLIETIRSVGYRIKAPA